MALKNILVKEDNKTILDIESFEVAEEDVIGLMGKNGSGKSTLLRVLTLLQEPQKGHIFFEGKDNFNEREKRLEIALVFQESLLFKGSVENNIAYPLVLRKTPPDDIKRVCNNVMKEFEISHLKDKQALKLSGGEAKRVCLARALVYQPSLLLLDEPFNDLDSNISQKIEEILFSYLKSKKTSVVFVSHDFEAIVRFCNKLAIMQNGKILRHDVLGEVMKQPKEKAVADILGNSCYIEAIIEKTDDELAIAKVAEYKFSIASTFSEEIKTGQKVIISIRPEDIFISNNGALKKSSVRNSYQAKIVKIIDNKIFKRLKLDSGFLTEAIITKQSLEELKLREGMIVTAGFKATAVSLIRKQS